VAVYFGLPMTGRRLPDGGFEELRRRIFEDAVLSVYRHVAGGAADEFPAAWAAVRAELGIAEGPIGVLGGSMGGMAAQLALADGSAPTCRVRVGELLDRAERGGDEHRRARPVVHDCSTRSSSLDCCDVLGPAGFFDVASMAFHDRFGCWAFLDLWRADPAAAFTRADAHFLTTIVPPVTAALRRCQAATFTAHHTDIGRRTPLVLLLSPDLTIRAQTPGRTTTCAGCCPRRPSAPPFQRLPTTSPRNCSRPRPASTTIPPAPASTWPTASGSPCVPPGSETAARRTAVTSR
jgi:pimeloyl-ACP methyl ester carboxylesterase